MSVVKRSLQVSVYLKGDELKPSAVSEKIGVAPTRSHEKGDHRITRSGSEVVEKTGIWVLTVRGDEAASLSSLVGEIGRTLGKLSSPLDLLPGVHTAFIDVLVMGPVDEDGGGTCEFFLDATAAAILGEMRLPIQFTAAVIVP